MPDTAAQKLADLWSDRRAPAVEGVCFADGRTVLLRLTLDEGAPPSVRRLGRSELTSFWEFNPDAVVSLVPTRSVAVPEHGLRVRCGDGSCGGDGFVAVSGLDSDRLVWLAFFENSGPFRQIDWRPTEALVRAVSVPRDAALAWSFPLTQPELVTVEPSAPIWAETE